jgi:hypothetical protein
VKETKVEAEPEALVAFLRSLSGTVVVVGLEAGPLSHWLYKPLKELNLGCSLGQEGKKAGWIEFIEGGWHPGSSECWVELRNDLTVSLVQAEIVERDLPIKRVVDEA